MLSVEGLSSLSLFMWPCECLWVHTSLRPRIKINKWTFLRMTASLLSTRENVQWEWTFLRVICFRNLRTPAEMSTVDQSQQCILVYTLYSYTLPVLDTHLTNLVHVALTLHEWGMSFEIIWPMADSGSERERLTDRQRTPISEATRSIDLCHLKNIYFENFCCKSSNSCF